MATQRYTRQVAPETGVGNPMAGNAGEVLANELQQFSARRAQNLQNIQEVAGQRAGIEAGQRGETGNPNAVTTYGKAFRQGAMLSHQAAVQTDIRDSIGRFQIESPDDPQAFDVKVKALREGLLQEADPEMQVFVQQRIADYAGRAQLSIIEAQQQKLRQSAAADLAKGQQGLFDDATTAAYEGDFQLAEARRQEFDSLLKSGVESQLIEQGKADQLRTKFDHDVKQQEIVGSFNRVLTQQGPEEANKSLERWLKSDPSSSGLTVDEHQEATRQMITLKNQFEATQRDAAFKRDASYRAEVATRTKRVQDSIGVMTSGFSPKPEDVKQATQDITWLRSSPDPADQQKAVELARDFDVAAQIQGQAARFRRMSQPQRDAEIQGLEAQLRKGGATADQVQLLKSLQSVSSSIDSQLNTDPRGYAIANNLMEERPLDFSSGQALSNSIAARIDQAEVGKQLTGNPIPRLSQAEAKQMAQLYNAAPIEDKVMLLGSITMGAGEDAAATLGLLDKQGEKQMALLGDMVMHGNRNLVTDIMRGQALIAADKTILPKQIDFSSDLADVWQGALQDWPEERAAYFDAAKAKYAELKAKQGDLTDTYNRKLFTQALAEVLPTAKFNGRRVAIPQGTDPDKFTAWTKRLTDADFVGVAGGPTTPDKPAGRAGRVQSSDFADMVRSRGRLVEMPGGQYGVVVTSALATAGEKILVKQDGTPFLLKFTSE